ncbi:MAG: formate--tetrahydrofolate ligase [Gemmatimonadota bacterium]
MPTDIEIAQCATLRPIREVAEELGLGEAELRLYGHYVAKVDLETLLARKPTARLVLVTAMTPTPAGEGKSTVSVGLVQALRRLGRNAVLCLREPSLGPVFGMKGGAAGGGYSQVLPMEEINLHFTGDFHAITAANSLLSAALDNNLHRGNSLGIDPRRIQWQRATDMNDRALRRVVVGLGGALNGVPREERFTITAASEVMAIFCLATDLRDLEERLARIVLGVRSDGTLVSAAELKVSGAMALLMRDALAPNLVQTLEGGPAFVHGGPFANIAHGCSSLIATRAALTLGDIVVTEAGFASELGAEKFFDIKCRTGKLTPHAAVVVATIRALKRHAGLPAAELTHPNPEAVRAGFPNLLHHIENVKQFGVPTIVAVNRFASDSEQELTAVTELCKEAGAPCETADVWARGGEGGESLAARLLQLLEDDGADFRPLYPLEVPLAEKLETIATRAYGARGINMLPAAERAVTRFVAAGYGDLPVCVAKTQYSLSDNPALHGRPCDFEVTVRELRLSAGAGFVVALTGDVLTMPGLPARPAAEAMRVHPDGRIEGLF